MLLAPSSHYSTSCRCNSDSLTNSSCQVSISTSPFYVRDESYNPDFMVRPEMAHQSTSDSI